MWARTWREAAVALARRAFTLQMRSDAVRRIVFQVWAVAWVLGSLVGCGRIPGEEAEVQLVVQEIGTVTARIEPGTYGVQIDAVVAPTEVQLTALFTPPGPAPVTIEFKWTTSREAAGNPLEGAEGSATVSGFNVQRGVLNQLNIVIVLERPLAALNDNTDFVNPPSFASIVAPTDIGAGQPVNVSAVVDDNGSVVAVNAQFFDANGSVGQSVPLIADQQNPASYSGALTAPAAGAYTLRFSALDNDNLSTSEDLFVLVK
jgi:hypothetical protein